MYNFAKKELPVRESLIIKKNARGAAGLAGIGAGIGAIREVGILRDKINKRYTEECAKADARGLPRPPKPDTSTKTLLAVLKGSVKGALVGTAVGFIPGVGRGLKDTIASIGAGTNKLISGNTLDGKVRTFVTNPDGTKTLDKAFSFTNTFLPREGEVLNEYTLSYLTDQDFSEIDLNNLDIGEVTEMDLYKMFFSLANAASKSFTKQELNEYFSRKKVIQDNTSVTDADVKMHGMTKAAMPVLGAIAGGGINAVKARKRALQQWEVKCQIADAKGLPRPPKPSILKLAGDVGKGAAVGAGIGWVGSKVAPGLNEALGDKLAKFGLTSAKAQNEAAWLANKNAKAVENLENPSKVRKFMKNTPILNWFVKDKLYFRKDKDAFFSYTDYRAALARKGQVTTLTEEQFYSIPEEGYEILIRNMEPMNFSNPYEEYKSYCKKQGVTPMSKADFIAYGGMLSMHEARDKRKFGGAHSVLGGLGAIGYGALGVANGIGTVPYEAIKGLGRGIKKGIVGTRLTTDAQKENNGFTYEDYVEYAKSKGLEVLPKPTWLSLQNFNRVTDALGSAKTKIGNKLNDISNASAEKYMGTGAVIGTGLGTVAGAIKANKSYDEYKAEAEANGEQPIPRALYIAKSKEFWQLVAGGAVEGAMTGLTLKGVSMLGNK